MNNSHRLLDMNIITDIKNGVKKMHNKILLICLGIIFSFFTCSLTWAHCQIPCGIYDDEARFSLIFEHINTIEKSMNKITELSSNEAQNMNQVVRWVNNKESHTDQLSEIVTFYFMAQRIKVVDLSDKVKYQKYVSEVTMLHQILVNVMKAKQTTDKQYIANLVDLVTKFKTSYLNDKGNDKG